MSKKKRVGRGKTAKNIGCAGSGGPGQGRSGAGGSGTHTTQTQASPLSLPPVKPILQGTIQASLQGGLEGQPSKGDPSRVTLPKPWRAPLKVRRKGVGAYPGTKLVLENVNGLFELVTEQVSWKETERFGIRPMGPRCMEGYSETMSCSARRVRRLSKDRWMVTCCVSREDAQPRCWIAGKQLVAIVVMNETTSINDSKNAFAVGLRGSEVVPVGSRVDDSLHQAERSAYEERCAEWFHIATFELSFVVVALGVAFSGQARSRSRENWAFQATHPKDIRHTWKSWCSHYEILPISSEVVSRQRCRSKI